MINVELSLAFPLLGGFIFGVIFLILADRKMERDATKETLG